MRGMVEGHGRRLTRVPLHHPGAIPFPVPGRSWDYRVTRFTNPITIRSIDLISLPIDCAGLRWLCPAR